MKREGIKIIKVGCLVGVVLVAILTFIYSRSIDKKEKDAYDQVMEYLEERYELPIKITNVEFNKENCIIEASQPFEGELSSSIGHKIRYSPQKGIEENIFGEMIEEKVESDFQEFNTRRYFDSGEHSAPLDWLTVELRVDPELFMDCRTDNPSYKDAYKKMKEVDPNMNVNWHLISQAHNKWEGARDLFDLIRYLEDRQYRYDSIDVEFIYKKNYIIDEILESEAKQLFSSNDEEGVFEHLIRLENVKVEEEGTKDLSEEDKEAFKALYEYTYKHEGTELKCPYPDAGWE